MVVRVLLQGPTQARKLKMWATGTGRVEPHVGKTGLESMLDPKMIRDPRGGAEYDLIFWSL